MAEQNNHKERFIDSVKKYMSTKNIYFAIKILIAFTSIWTAHLVGYIEAIGVGVRNFIGFEVSGDLFFEFISKLSKSAIFSILYITPILIAVQLLKFSALKYLLIKVSLFTAFCLASFLPNYLQVRSFTATLGYATIHSELLFLAVIASIFGILYLCQDWLFDIFIAFFSALILAGAYYAGELKAESFPEIAPRHVIFLDDTILTGYPLHRVEGGIIFRKESYFPFDTGSVFIPYAAIKMVTEPPRDQSGKNIISNDYPGIIKNEIQKESSPPAVQEGEQE